MKRMLLSAAALLLSLTLTACSGGANTSSQGESSRPESSVPSSSQAQESSESSAVTSSDLESQTSSQPESAAEESTETGESGGTLIAYFSWSGNTEQLAHMIQTETGGELFEIAPATPYTEDYNTLLDVAQQEQADNARPELASQVENWDSYSTVFVGYPDWWSDAPHAHLLLSGVLRLGGQDPHPLLHQRGQRLWPEPGQPPRQRPQRHDSGGFPCERQQRGRSR